jgi:hypothetical protein
MRYLNTKPGSIEEVAASMSKYAAESEYQDMFKKELEKAGKGIGAMTPKEKKAFFNKIDSKYTAKDEAVDNPYAVGMAQAMKAKNDQPPLKKSTITKAHDIAKSIEKDQKEEVEVQETHSFVTNKQNEKQKKVGGEKDIVDPAPSIKKESLYDSIKSVWQISAEEMDKIKSEAKYYKKEQNKNDLKSKKIADTGSESTPVDVEPKVEI